MMFAGNDKKPVGGLILAHAYSYVVLELMIVLRLGFI